MLLFISRQRLKSLLNKLGANCFSFHLRGCLEKAKIAHYCVAVMLAFVEYYLYTPRLCFSLLVLHQFNKLYSPDLNPIENFWA